MIIEVTGPSGAGKSTVIAQLKNSLANTQESIFINTGCEQESRSLPSYILEPNTTGVKADCYLFPWAMLFSYKYRKFFWFSLTQIAQRKRSPVPRLSILRSFLRKAGVFCYFQKRKFCNSVIIIDEGISHMAQLYFAHPIELVKKQSLDAYAQLLPKPDVLVIVNTEATLLIQRSINRDDFYPPTDDQQLIKNFAIHSHQIYNDLSVLLNQLCRLIQINTDTPNSEKELANIIRRFIHAKL